MTGLLTHLKACSETRNRREFHAEFVGIQSQIDHPLGARPFEKSKQTTTLLLEHAPEDQSDFWILNHGTLKGRIGAWISPLSDGVGKLGFFEACSLESSRVLLDQATSWLLKRGVTKVYGPVDQSTWFDYRFRVNWDDPWGFDFEPQNPPQYPQWWQELGFKISETYHSHGISNLGALAQRLETDYHNACERGFQFRAFGATGDLHQELRVIHEMSELAFSNHFLFESLPFSMFQGIYFPKQKTSREPLAYFVVSPEGEELGFTFNWIESKYLVMKTILLSPKARGHRLSNALLHVPTNEANERGVSCGIAALVRDGLQSERYTQDHELLWKHEYAVMMKDLR